MATPQHRLKPALYARRQPANARPTRQDVPPRIESLYVGAVSFTLGAAGTAIGFLFGVIPYFHTANFPRYDGFFVACCIIGAAAGFVIGVVNGARWYRSAESSPLAQRRMLSYLRRRGMDPRGVPARTLNTVSLRSLLGQNRTHGT